MPTITDWLMVGITAVYVIATIFICWANINSAKATREQVAESKRQFDEANRAFVVVSFEIIRSGLAALCVQNCGNRIAQNVNVHVSPEFLENMVDESNKKHLKKMSESTFSIGINQRWYICIGSHLQLEQMSKELLRINLTYQDAISCYSEKVEIDLKQYFWTLIYDSPTEDIYQQMKKQTDEMKKVQRELHIIAQAGKKEVADV